MNSCNVRIGTPAAALRAEGVAQVVEAVRLVEAGVLERPTVAAQDRGLVERPARVGIGENEVIVVLPARRLEEPVKLTGYGTGERDGARRAPRLRGAETTPTQHGGSAASERVRAPVGSPLPGRGDMPGAR